ncbi:MAG: hypothetical protein ABWJ97_03310 [Thermoproteus sp.]
MKLALGFYRFFLERGGFLVFLSLAALAWIRGLHLASLAIALGFAASLILTWRTTTIKSVYCGIEGQRLTHINVRGNSVSLRYGNAVFSVKGYENILAAFECASRRAPAVIDAIYKFIEPKFIDVDLRGACIYAFLVGNNKDMDLYICEGGIDIGLSLRGGCPVIMAAPRILEDLGATIIKRSYSGAIFASAFFKHVEDAVKFINGLADFCRPGKACEGLTAKECLSLYRLLFS